MKVLLDTNILVRIEYLVDPDHQLTVNVVDVLKRRNDHLFVVPQNIYEFSSVATATVEQCPSPGMRYPESQGSRHRKGRSLGFGVPHPRA